MNTPSHFIITAALRKSLRKRVTMPARAILTGSIAPDLPVYLMTLGAFLYFRVMLGWDSQQTFEHIFNDLYFHDPFWLAAHNMLHSPTLLVLVLAILCSVARRRKTTPRWPLWFLAACLFHTTIDVLTHHDDGPLLFFPFEWTTRFHSPISYWDPEHFGSYFAPIEIALDLLLLLYLCTGPVLRRLKG